MNWSPEIFTIYEVNRGAPETYLIKSQDGEKIAGMFYKHELQKSNFPNVFLVEKVLKESKDKLLVKWLGFESSASSWVKKSDILI